MTWTRPVGRFAAAGLVASLAVHLAALAGHDLQTAFPPVFALHLGAMAAFVPTFIVVLRVSHAMGFDADRLAVLRMIFWHVPRPMAAAVAVTFVYGFVNFFLAGGAADLNGAVSQQGDQYLLTRRGMAPVAIDAATFHAAEAAKLRAFSGHWMAFFAFSTAVLNWPPPKP